MLSCTNYAKKETSTSVLFTVEYYFVLLSCNSYFLRNASLVLHHLRADCGTVRMRTQIRIICWLRGLAADCLVDETKECGRGLARILFLDEYIIFW